MSSSGLVVEMETTWMINLWALYYSVMWFGEGIVGLYSDGELASTVQCIQKSLRRMKH